MIADIVILMVCGGLGLYGIWERFYKQRVPAAIVPAIRQRNFGRLLVLGGTFVDWEDIR